MLPNSLGELNQQSTSWSDEGLTLNLGACCNIGSWPGAVIRPAAELSCCILLAGETADIAFYPYMHNARTEV